MIKPLSTEDRQALAQTHFLFEELDEETGEHFRVCDCGEDDSCPILRYEHTLKLQEARYEGLRREFQNASAQIMVMGDRCRRNHVVNPDVVVDI